MAISMVVIPLMTRVAPRLGMMDRPSARKVHDVPMARVGGWGIVLGALFPLLMVLPMDRLFQSYVFGAVVLLGFGTWDDIREVGHYPKFLGQLIAVLPVVTYGGLFVERLPFMGAETIPRGLGMPFTVFAMVGVINAINHSDGLDGLAGGESLLSLMVIAVLAQFSDGYAAVLVALSAMGGVLGFLRYNTHPARVFMGDSGSQYLGFTLGFLTVLLTQRFNPALSPAIPALLLGLPLIDILAVLAQRIYHGMNWFRATKNHIHHRLLGLGLDHYETVVITYSVQAVFVTSAFFLRYEWDALITGFYLATCGAIFLLLVFAERTGWHAHRRGAPSLLSRLLSPVRAHWLFKAGPVFWVAAAVPVYIVFGSAWAQTVPRDFGVASTVLFVVLLVEVVIGRNVRSIIARGAVYVSAVFVIYLVNHYPPAPVSGLDVAEAGYFALLAAAIALGVRYGLDVKFGTTPMDYLFVFAAVALGLFSTRMGSGQEMGKIVVECVIMLYGCELLFARTRRRWSGLSLSSLLALGVLGARGLF
jgi:UDP-GlcNAc:undecaprenyl-phosphate GlcNAc-1-phosphate transferase